MPLRNVYINKSPICHTNACHCGAATRKLACTAVLHSICFIMCPDTLILQACQCVWMALWLSLSCAFCTCTHTRIQKQMQSQATNWTEKPVTSSTPDTHANTIFSPREGHAHSHTHTMTAFVTSPRRCQLTHWEQGGASGWFALKCLHRFGSLRGSMERKTI